MSLTLEDIRRRRDGKRANERLKLLASFLNTLAAGLLGAGIFVPWLTAAQFHPDWQWVWLWILAAFGLHIAGQLILGLLMSED